jgi:hypothetical protein
MSCRRGIAKGVPRGTIDQRGDEARLSRVPAITGVRILRIGLSPRGRRGLGHIAISPSERAKPEEIDPIAAVVRNSVSADGSGCGALITQRRIG